jgi:peptide/nickel transport system substrate-binding protein
VINDGKTLHPYTTTSATDLTTYQPYIYAAALLYRDPATSFLRCQACQSYQLSDDALTVTFKLRTDIKWSDGQPITSDDYVWTFKQAFDPANKWNYLDDYKDQIDSITGPDPLTVVVKLKDKFFNALSIAGTTFEPLPRHAWEGKDWSDVTKNPAIDNPTVVSGPWKLKEWKKGDHITFVRNDASTVWPAPYLNSVTYQVIKDQSVAYQKMKSGELTYGSPNQADFADFQKNPPAGLTSQTYYKTASSWSYIGFNLRKPYLKDLPVRQAINYAIDKQGVIDNFVYGLGKPTYTDVQASDPTFYTEDGVNKYPYDLDKAKQTLTDGGYKIDGGVLKDKTGQAVPKMKILYNSGNPVRKNIAVYTQSQLKELGISADLVELDFNAYLDQISKDPFDYDLFVLGWSSSFEVQTFGDVWKNIPDLNSGAWSNDQVTKLYDQVRKTTDPAAQVPIMHQIEQIESNDPPYVYLFLSEGYIVYSNKLHISKANNLGVLYNEYVDWYLDQ